MERNANESFADYKVRRAAANLAVKNINWKARSSGQSARAKQRQSARANKDNNFSVGIKGMASSVRSPMGLGIAASAAAKRLTMARALAHKAHAARVAERSAIRAAGNDSWLKHAA